MIAVLFLLLPAQVSVDVRDIDRTARLTASAAKEGSSSVFQVNRRVGTMKRTLKGMQLTETWRQEVMELAVERKGRWEGIATLSRPGRYDVRIGSIGGILWISRTNFDTWEKDLRDLRGMTERLQRIAAEIDAAPNPDRAQAARWQREIHQEKARLQGLRTEFDAGLEALRDAIERLRLHRTLVEFAGAKAPTQDDEGYKVGEAQRDPNGITAARQIEGIASVIQREGTVKLLDEMVPLLAPDAESTRLNRWKDSPRALAAIREAHQTLAGPAELTELLRELLEGADAATVVEKAKELRKKQID